VALTPPIPCFSCRQCDGAPSRLAGGDIVSMSRDETSDFRPRPGRIRDRGARAGRQPRSFVAQVMKAAAKANGVPLTKSRGRNLTASNSTRARKGRCSRIGRGHAVADRLKFAAGQRTSGQRMRRVVVKARIVRLKTASRAALAHLTYLQRDGTTRDGGRGPLYGPDSDLVDGRALVERSQGDRHQFRFIVAPEDGDRLSESSTGSQSITSTPAIRTAIS
jgi:hypothetical protein